MIDLTPRNRIAPLLFKLAWRCYPLFHSREYGWIYRVPSISETSKRIVSDVLQPCRLDSLRSSCFSSCLIKMVKKQTWGLPLARRSSSIWWNGTGKDTRPVPRPNQRIQLFEDLWGWHEICRSAPPSQRRNVDGS
ncbi:hypothetical protein F5887DRAFT_1033867 [Amanita rubescens]|nr:hypothetical protein F5887DRAFT_1033867 [Amanita rubescens]